MATRLIGTDPADPRLPDVVIAASIGTTAADLAPGNVQPAASTIDTLEPYRIIVFSDGHTRAIPVDAEPPGLPTDLTPTLRISSVKLEWTAPVDAVSYVIYRDGEPYGTSSTTLFRDNSVTIDETYLYAVQAVSEYDLRSEVTDTVEAYIDIALNFTPTIDIRVWPTTPIPAGQTAIVRVNGRDVDSQVLAYTLGVDAGSLVATLDPVVWHLETPTPVVVGTIGYETIGSAAVTAADSYGLEAHRPPIADLVYTASTGDVVTAVYVYGSSAGSGTTSVAIYATSGSTIGAMVGSPVTVNMTPSVGWRSTTCSIPLTAGVTYTCAYDWWQGTAITFYRNTGLSSVRRSHNFGTTLPDPWVEASSTSSESFSFYAEVSR